MMNIIGTVVGNVDIVGFVAIVIIGIFFVFFFVGLQFFVFFGSIVLLRVGGRKKFSSCEVGVAL